MLVNSRVSGTCFRGAINCLKCIHQRKRLKCLDINLAEEGQLPVSLPRAERGTRTPVAERLSTKSLKRGLFPLVGNLGLLPKAKKIEIKLV